MAIAASANLILILFDLTYVPFRNVWLLGKVNIPIVDVSLPIPLPQATLCPSSSLSPPDTATLITQCYDWIKGIEPHRETEGYLSTVNRLEKQVLQGGLNQFNSPTIATTLQELGQQSADMIASNPFAAVGKSGTLEKIKNLMRDRMKTQLKTLSPTVVANPFPDSDNPPSEEAAPKARISPKTGRKISATDSFRVFWSPAHLNANTWQTEMAWFNKELRPLMQTNYFRSISEDGSFTNQFWKIDIWFWGLFVAEFLGRTFFLSRRHARVSWLDTMIWRWYDIPLLLPFGLVLTNWAWLRGISVVVRLHQSRLVDMDRVRQQATQGLVGSIAEEITEVVVIQILNQVQEAVRQGNIMDWLLKTQPAEQITVNDVDEVPAIASLLIKLTVYQVFPKIKPDLAALLQHGVESILNQSSAYQTLKTLPGVGNLPSQLTERIVTEVIQTSYGTLTAVLEDPKNEELTQRLVQNFIQSFGAEVQQQHVLEELRSLLTDLLEEVKLNYMQQAMAVNVDAVLEETRQLQQIASKTIR
jgi:hypothetical protein